MEGLKREGFHKEYVKKMRNSTVSASAQVVAAKMTSVSYSDPVARRRAAENGVFSNLPGRYYADNYRTGSWVAWENQFHHELEGSDR